MGWGELQKTRQKPGGYDDELVKRWSRDGEEMPEIPGKDGKHKVNTG